MRARLSFGHFRHDLWVAFFIIMIVAGVFTSQGVVIAFGVMGLVAGVISLVWNNLALEEVSYERHLPLRRAFTRRGGADDGGPHQQEASSPGVDPCGG